ncbi:hypothetical protein JK358_15615 [Nocardia sp. 2]|uniref:Resolvase/invertase-type recombinase catalytic domain-containing protein n=1 Tax=Nocardia acididurans TaxID=2802282 RepID=A0ABS1M591_9NOCA|nr:hypothetical protein [Nocardia acididurans]
MLYLLAETCQHAGQVDVLRESRRTGRLTVGQSKYGARRYGVLGETRGHHAGIPLANC